MKINELTKFAITLGLLPWIPAFILYKHGQIKWAAGIICVLVLLSLISFISKKFAAAFKSLVTVIGEFIGRYLAIIVLFIGYIVAVIPTGLLMKIVKRDRLKLKKPNINTYWQNYENKSTDYEYQF